MNGYNYGGNRYATAWSTSATERAGAGGAGAVSYPSAGTNGAIAIQYHS